MRIIGAEALDLVRAVESVQRSAPSLPVLPALQPLLPHGLRRGSTVSVRGSVSLLLALLGAASADGAWCALVGMPSISAEAAAEYGVVLERFALIPEPRRQWATAVGALLDAVDLVVTRPPARVAPGEARRLVARARNRDAVLLPYTTAGEQDGWPGAEVRITARDGQWHGLGDGNGRLRYRGLTVATEGRGRAARPHSATLWLPAPGGGAVPEDTAAQENAAADPAPLLRSVG